MRSTISPVFRFLASALLGIAAAGCDSAPSAKPSPMAAPSADPADAAPAPAAPAAPPGRSKEWPMWGGTPARNMVNTIDTGVPHDFDVEKGKHVRWTAKLGSQTYGNPVIAGGRVFVGTNNTLERNQDIKGDRGVLMCFDAKEGKFLWQAVHDKLASGRVNDWPEQGICSTACVENGRVYYVSNRAQLICADMDGFTDNENDGPYQSEQYKSPIDADFIWVLDMIEDLTVFPHNLATSSPVIAGDLIFIMTSNGVDESHIDIPSPDAPSFIAVDKNSGKVVWEDGAPGKGILHGQWSSPAYGKFGGVEQVVFAAGNGWAYGLEPKTGKHLWSFDLNPKDAKYVLGGRGTRCYIIATPVIAEEQVFLAVGQDPEHGEGPGHLYCIDPRGKSGDITESGRVWHLGDKDFHRTLSTVAVHDGLVYAVDLSGFLNCLDVKTGKPYWVYDMLAAVWGSPMVVDGKVFLGDEDGDLVVLRHGKKLEKLAEHQLGNSVYSTPVVADGTLYIANRTTLFAISAAQ